MTRSKAQPKAKVWAREQIDRHAEICKAKYRYRDRQAAQSRAKAIKLEDGIKLRPYQCAVCSQWHLRSDDDATRVRRGQYLIKRTEETE